MDCRTSTCELPPVDEEPQHDHTSPPEVFVSERGLTSKLPNDMLMQVFSNIPSIPHKFRLAAVNKRFRRCMFTEMKKPTPFKMEWQGGLCGRLCGHNLPRERWPTAVEVLAAEARFNKIVIGSTRSWGPFSQLSQILRALRSTPACLALVTKIKIYFIIIYSDDGLDSVIAKCPRLSVFSMRGDGWIHSVDLISALHGKPLTQLDLALKKCNQQDAIDLLRTVQPNTLKTLKLLFKDSLDVVPLVEELCRTSPQSIEFIRLSNTFGDGDGGPSVPQLYALIPHLPLLRHLDPPSLRVHEDSLIELISALKLLSNEPRQSELDLCLEYPEVNRFSFFCWCQMLDGFRQVPGLMFTIHTCPDLSLGNVTMSLYCDIVACPDPLCVTCRTCYPAVLGLLKDIVDEQEDMHIEDLWLNPCKVGCVADHLNGRASGRQHWRALNAEHWRDQNGEQAVIFFEREDYTEFQVTLDTARCIDHSCKMCPYFFE